MAIVRRRFLSLLLLSALWWPAPVLPQESPSAVQAVAAVGLTVSDIERAVDFYSGVLDFQKVSDVEVAGEAYDRLQGLFGLRMRVVRLRLGTEDLVLTEYLTPRGRPIPPDSRSNDRWFQHIAIAVADMDAAYARLRERKVRPVSTAPQRLPDWNKAAAGIRAFYFQDPDGHNLEIITFPPGKGDPRWQRPGGQLFLGIDHTAIVVADTEASLGFYRDRLGLRLAGESENYGTEQEHLNHVFGARLRISSLRPPKGPGIEFLEYLTPRDGRPFPEDERANDLVHWQTTLVVPDAQALSDRLRADRVRFVSPQLSDLGERHLGFRRGFLVRDPDGHVLQIVER
ncbi:VOC family protein [Gloeobacter violaceus]|uniref:Glr1161 protein n=1 Tax=Gloeobacter violaceus (strain ATCC 29082 / PCC 7421) TaxID=251221 RepID=Q7NLG3_GLOVI|nr:VOC family protein [Gloeobacter violaceus]BAC89102.1 glr1161 [Gloeobacter violaceus PCC 7421]